MEKIHLVTNNNILSLSKNRKNIFLGGWCYNYLKKNDYKEYKFEVIKTPSLYYCDRNENFSKDCNNLIKQTLKDLKNYFNYFHNKNYDERYWSLLISPWINNFVSTYLYLKHSFCFFFVF